MPSPLCILRNGDSVEHGTRLFALFRNDGGHDVANAVVHAVINDALGSTIYDRTGTIPSISGGGGIVSQYFSDFVPQTAGTYCVIVSIISDSTEDDSLNNSTSWCCTVSDSSTGTDSSGSSGPSRLDHGDHMLDVGASAPVSATPGAEAGESGAAIETTGTSSTSSTHPSGTRRRRTLRS